MDDHEHIFLPSKFVDFEKGEVIDEEDRCYFCALTREEVIRSATNGATKD